MHHIIRQHERNRMMRGNGKGRKCSWLVGMRGRGGGNFRKRSTVQCSITLAMKRCIQAERTSAFTSCRRERIQACARGSRAAVTRQRFRVADVLHICRCVAAVNHAGLHRTRAVVCFATALGNAGSAASGRSRLRRHPHLSPPEPADHAELASPLLPQAGA
ncbi:hypothetical protein B0H17DRAFT_1123931 [Mycena rosella]|uniref:Uncharacterized protein n=1 Tax=Mycena rosella TaxID=1033263 RepID=A0AAD7MD94_MYCRO|nr:hypothetical protein B0H17DRAFT_1123931 [Mycena rosella]